MENRKPEAVPYIVYEGEMTRQERHIKRLWIALIAAIAALAVCASAFIWYLSLYDFSDYNYSQDGQGVNIIGNGNGVERDVADLEGTYQDAAQP